MRVIRPLTRFLLCATVLSLTCAVLAQGPHGHDRDDGPHGHDRDDRGHDRDDRGHGRQDMPPGQAKKYGHDHDMPPGQARKYDDDRHMPPGRARGFRFHDEDRGRFYAHYHEDADHWRDRRRPVFIPGHYVPSGFVVQAVPRAYWVGVVAPPPPGYVYGYAGGYIVAYSPATRIVADVIDIVGTAAAR